MPEDGAVAVGKEDVDLLAQRNTAARPGIFVTAFADQPRLAAHHDGAGLTEGVLFSAHGEYLGAVEMSRDHQIKVKCPKYFSPLGIDIFLNIKGRLQPFGKGMVHDGDAAGDARLCKGARGGQRF